MRIQNRGEGINETSKDRYEIVENTFTIFERVSKIKILIMRRNLIDTIALTMISISLLTLQFSCNTIAKISTTNTGHQTDFLKGYWDYANGAQAYYDGVSNYAKGTKVPINNCYQFVVGEDYWEDLKSTGNNTWSVNQAVRYCQTGVRVYSPTIFTKVNDSTIRLQNSLLGTEYLIRHSNN